MQGLYIWYRIKFLYLMFELFCPASFNPDDRHIRFGKKAAELF